MVRPKFGVIMVKSFPRNSGRIIPQPWYSPKIAWYWDGTRHHWRVRKNKRKIVVYHIENSIAVERAVINRNTKSKRRRSLLVGGRR